MAGLGESSPDLSCRLWAQTCHFQELFKLSWVTIAISRALDKAANPEVALSSFESELCYFVKVEILWRDHIIGEMKHWMYTAPSVRSSNFNVCTAWEYIWCFQDSSLPTSLSSRSSILSYTLCTFVAINIPRFYIEFGTAASSYPSRKLMEGSVSLGTQSNKKLDNYLVQKINCNSWSSGKKHCHLTLSPFRESRL